MFEDTNQTNEELFPEELFSEEQEDIAQDAAEGTPTDAYDVPDDTDVSGDEEGGEETETPTGDEQTIRLSFLGEERDVPLSEAIMLAQKGLNYDHVAEQRESLRRENAILDEYAKQSGMTREEYIEYLRSSLGDLTHNRELSALRERYPDADEELLSEMAEQGIRLRARDEEKQAQTDLEEAERARRAPWNDFFREFPDIKPETLTQDFYDQVGQGKSPTEVYLRNKIRELEEQAVADEKNRENAARAVGSARGDGERAARDPFLEGFFSN